MASYDTAQKGIENSLQKAGLDYFDLYLLNIRQCDDYFSAWRAMEDAYRKES
jgi:diketogulonate reductase-like aldo/keto reductase